MKKYWFYLESYAFIWYNDQEGIIYNSLNHKNFNFKNRGIIKDIIIGLNDIKNMYCIEVFSKDFDNTEFKEFVSKSVEINVGFIVNTTEKAKKPISLVPRLKLLRDFDHPDKSSMLEKDVRNYLTEVSFYLNGECNINCCYCSTYFKQTEFCTKSKNELSIECIDSFLSKISNSNLRKINILGGNIWEFKDINLLIEKLNKFPIKKEFFSHYLNFPLNNYSSRIDILDKKDNSINLLLNFPLQPQIKEIIKRCNEFNLKVAWTIVVASTSDFNCAVQISKRFNFKEYKIKPVFTGCNEKFFQNYVFLSKNDILSSNVSRRQIFSREVINAYDFGKLIVFSDGKILANINNDPIGNINSNLNELLFNELKNGISWRRTRLKNKPCNNCIYRLLCPSPSNYELILEKSNLCTIN